MKKYLFQLSSFVIFVTMRKSSETLLLNDGVMITLALFSVFLLLVDVIYQLTPDQTGLVHLFDIIIALIFLLEFLYNLYHAKDRSNFFKHYWWELLAAIPITTHTTQVFRALKLTRAIPLLETFRFLRFLVRIKIVIDESVKRTHHAYLIYTMLVITCLVVAAASAFYFFENGTNPSVNSFDDSLWWAIVTVSTIGYGDIYPHTPEGRVVAVFLILTGIAALGAFVAAINHYVVKSILKGKGLE